MTKTLQEIQQENRRLILEVIHGVSYEEALKKEKFKIGSLVKIKDDFRDQTYSFAGHSYVTTPYQGDIDYACLTSTDICGFSVRLTQLSEWYGKPLTLDRVLLALNPSKYGFLNGEIVHFGKEDNIWAGFWYNVICPWDLTKETLEKQSEETQRKINKLLNNE